MATFVYTNAYLTVNGVNLSDHVRSLTLTYEAEDIDSTAMSSSAARTRLAGLTNWSIEVEFSQDFASGSVDATLFPLVGAAPFAVALRPVNTTISTTNPEFQGNAILTSYAPMGGSVGELATTTATLMGTGTLTRDTTP